MSRRDPLDYSASLTRLLRPSNIAVIGGKWAEAVVLSCSEIGFAGEIWPVHPHKEMVAGHKAYPNLAALPAPPDAVFLGVNRKTSIDMVGQLSAMGAGGVVTFASGFAEVENGKEFQDQLVAAGGRYQKTEDWHPLVVADGLLITGQNPASSEPVADALLEALNP